MSSLPPARRIVTGHDAAGKAIIEDDRTFEPFNPLDLLSEEDRAKLPKYEEQGGKPKGGFIHLWRTEQSPAKIQGPWTEYQNKHIPLSDKVGTTLRIVDITPEMPRFFHRTVSLDYAVVLSGETVLELDDGVETTVKQGEIVIQRGTIHAWHNRTSEVCRVLFVLLPAENVVVDGKEVGPTEFAIN